MVVMVRALGIPARVAIGFTGGTQDPTTGAWTVTNKDAHAWPEVWFPQAGWTRFEPTQRDDGATAPPPYSSPASSATTPPAEATATPPAAEVVPVPVPVPVPAGQAIPTPATPSPTTSATPTEDGGSWTSTVAVGVGLALTAVVVLAVLAAPALLRRRTRNRRLAWARSRTAGAAGVHEAWSELVDLATDLGVPLSPSQSPRASAARLGGYLEAPQIAPDDHYSRQIASRSAGSPLSRTETLPSHRAIRGDPSYRRHLAAPSTAGRGFPLAGPESGEPRVRAAREALGRLARAEEHARYAPAGLPLHDRAARRLADDLATATATLWSVSSRRQRIRAVVVPPSLLARFGTTASETFRAVVQLVGRRLPGRSATGRADEAAPAVGRPAADSQRVVSGAGR
jgi:hypothetical protein